MENDKFLYRENYKTKITIIVILSFILSLLKSKAIEWDVQSLCDYHATILTVNSILCGFSLTNLGVLISISDDQLVEKLKGTSILIKRNTAISYVVVFGIVSIICAFIFILNVNYESLLPFPIDPEVKTQFKIFINYIEIISLIASIFYFVVSVKLMLKLLRYIYIPKKGKTKGEMEEIKKTLAESSKHQK